MAMKKRFVYAFIVLALAITAALSGCASVEYKNITDFTEYKDLETQSVTQISAKVIMRGLDYEEFTLSDKESVDGVMQALKNEKFIRAEQPSITDLSFISLYVGESLLVKISLNGIMQDGVYYKYSSGKVKDLIYNAGLAQDRFRGFYGLDYALAGKINLDCINKIMVSLQREGTTVNYEITEDGGISAIMNELRDNRAFIFIKNEWETTDESQITVFDNEGKSAVINLTQLKVANKGYFGEGYYKLINERVKQMIINYGVTNGYLQN